MSREYILKVRLNENERDELLIKSAAAQQTQAQYVRNAIISSSVMPQRSIVQQKRNQIVSNIASNLNQIARALNTLLKNGHVSDTQYHEQIIQLDMLYEHVKKLARDGEKNAS